MTAQDTAAIVKGIAPVILQVVSQAVAPLQVKIAALEAQLASLPTPKDGKDGKDAEPVDLDVLALKAAELIPVPKDGKDGAAPDVEEVAKVAALLIPAPKDGRDGKDAEPVRPEHIYDAVRNFLVLHPPEAGEKGDPGLNGKDGADGKDGIGLAGMLIDKDGTLVGTLSDGSMHTLGRVVGQDGEKGADGLQGPAGANGLNGKDGTIENIYPVLEGRMLTFKYLATGAPVMGWSVKFIGQTIFQGVWSSDTAYETGDQVLRDGSTWTAKADCQGKQPGTNEGGPFWQLSAKRGNDGKPGTKGLDGKDGKPGPPGRDGTRSY